MTFRAGLFSRHISGAPSKKFGRRASRVSGKPMYADDEVDFDFEVPEKLAMITAKKQLSGLLIPFEQRGHRIRVKLDCTYFDWTPTTGSLRFRGGTSFSS